MDNAKALGAQYVRLAWVPHDKPWDLTECTGSPICLMKSGKISKQILLLSIIIMDMSLSLMEKNIV